MRLRSTRRDFLRGSLAASAALGAVPLLRRRSPNERLDIGVVGVANRGRANLDEVAGENIVAICDVDEGFLAGAGETYERTRRYRDFRKMLEQEKLDAVVVSTPDHTHAAVTLAALDLGLPVYCEKPLTRSLREARRVREVAEKSGLATQMGTQIHAGSNYRRVVEIVQSGAIGPISRAHVVCEKAWWAPRRPEGEHAVPESLDYDLWCGPVGGIAYSPEYHPANWRRYWPFGGGTLADMGCHHIDLAFWALGLGHCASVEAEGPPVDAFGAPRWLKVRWQFPARGAAPPVELTWSDGGEMPEEMRELGLADWKNGVVFVGQRGWLAADYSTWRIGPAADFKGYEQPAPTLPDSIGHHREWIEACKDGRPTTCAFSYSGLLTEAVLLGSVAYRAGRKLEWDAAAMRVQGEPGLEELIDPPRRAGWEL